MRTNGMIQMIRSSAFLLLISSALLFGDTSAFSALSFGDLNPTLNGTTGTAFADSLVLRNHNYASWTGLSNTSFSVSASFYYNTVDTENGRSEYDRFTFEDLSFAMPFGSGNVLGFSYYPETVVDITGVTLSEEKVPESFEETTIRTLETKKGSLSNASLIYGKEVGKFSASVNSSFLFGNYETSRLYKYTSYVEGTELIDWEKYFEDRRTTQIFHFRIGGGLLYDAPYGIRLGASFIIPLYSNVEIIEKFSRTTSYGTVTETLSEEKSEVDDAEWPSEFALGLSYRYKDLVLSYDYTAKLFDGKNTGMNDGVELINYTRNTLGVSLLQRKRRFDPYYKRMVYSGYLSIEKRPYEYNTDLNDLNPVYDITGTLGLNFPFNNDRTNLELRLGYTVTGSKEENGIENRVFKVSFNFISSDRWRLRKQKYDD